MSKWGPRDRCGLCGEAAHSAEACDMVPLKPLVPDKPLPPRALLTLPEGLSVEPLSDSASYLVRSMRRFDRGARFGPFRAKKTSSLLPSIEFPLKIFSDDEEDMYLDTTDEETCNWLMYVPVACDLDEQNLICYQQDDELYYVVIRDLIEGDRLNVWYSPYYAKMMNKGLLTVTSPDVADSSSNHIGKVAMTVDELVEKRNVIMRSSWCCKFCGKAERKVTDFAQHLTQHYELKLRRVCEVCSGAFSSRKGLQKHMRIVHATTSPVIEAPTLQRPSVPVRPCPVVDRPSSDPLLVQTISDNNSCLVPVEQTGTANGLLGCLDNYDSSELNVDSILVDKGLDSFNFDLNESESEQLVCDVCLKTFQKLKQLVLHLQQHTGRYACLECNKVFTRKENFDHHLCRSFYKLKCPECDSLFLQAKHLRSHVDFVHLKRFSCDRCGARMRSDKSLKEHVCAADRPKATTKSRAKKKEEVESVTCPVCAKRFKGMRGYRKHERTAHGEKGFRCEECGGAFSRRDVLKEHVAAKHGGETFACATCGKTFKTERLLRRHQLTHSDLKPHRCSVCPMSFRTRSNLLRHVRTTHARAPPVDRPFACPRCPVRFKAKNSLLRHARRTHPGLEYPKRVSASAIPSEAPADDPKRTSAIPSEAPVDDLLETELRRTMERMDFNAESDIQVEIDKLLNDPANIDSLLSESNDRLVESLLEIAGTAQALSMPDLDAPT